MRSHRVRRREFCIAAGAFALAPRVARATGGLDQDAETDASMRVLLASGSFVPAQPIDAWHFAWEGHTYRGSFSIVRLPDGRAGLVNALPLDAYLYGVLGKEISPSWSPAAQQVQAIASRTYALGKIRPERPFDVIAAESDQHYGGIESESVECRAAIDATAGRIVTYAGAAARVAYSACCGGRTADAAAVWKTPVPYLTSVEDPNCSGAPNFAWSVAIASGDVALAFRPRADLGTLRDVRVESFGAGARPLGITFVGTSATFEASAADVRTALGPSIVRSTFVRSATLENGGATLALSGTGRGHGVGLCQWGARAMADRGADAAGILAFYFPGTALGRV